eukprot:10946970-Ditylum_brightwellii.AAC.1
MSEPFSTCTSLEMYTAITMFTKHNLTFTSSYCSMFSQLTSLSCCTVCSKDHTGGKFSPNATDR